MFEPSPDDLQKAFADLKDFRRRRLGEIAVEQGWVNRDQLDLCLDEQAAGSGQPLGQILMEKGLIEEGDLNALLREQENRDLQPFLAEHTTGMPPEVEEAHADPDNRFEKYVRIREIGRGGMGRVFKAWDLDLNRWVALKILKDTTSESARTRFLREARAAAGLRHPNLVTVYDAGEYKGQPYLAMELVGGGPINLHADQPLVLDQLRKVCIALDVAHRKGMVHRDLKPGNILVNGDSEPHIVDFGLVHLLDSDKQLTEEGTAIGTPQYMSPEQVRGEMERIGPGTDVYAIGSMIYEVLTGSPPHTSGSITDMYRKILQEDPRTPMGPRDLVTIATKCLEKDPHRRYALAGDLAEDLRCFIDGEPISARPISRLYRLKKSIARQKTLVATLLAVMITGGAVMGWLLPKTNRPKPPPVQPPTDRKEADRIVELGRKMMRNIEAKKRGEYDGREILELARETVAKFEEALNLVPKHAQALLEIGRTHALARDPVPAMEYFNRAVEADPEFAAPYLERVRARLDEYEKFRHGSMGMAAEDPGLRDAIEADLDRLQKLDMRPEEKLYGEALLAFADGEYGIAADELAKYLKAATGDGTACYWLGHSLYHERRYTEAIEAFDRAIATDTQFTTAYRNRALAWKELGKIDKAVADLETVIRRYPVDFQSHWALATIHFEQENFPAAVRHYAFGLKVNPNHSGPFYHCGLSRAKIGQFRDAIRDFSEAIRLRSDFTQAFVNRGNCHRELKDLRSALADYERAVKIDPDLFEGRVMVGRVAQDLRDFDKALKAFTEAIRIRPEDPMSYAERGNLLLKVFRDKEKAAKNFREALKRAPKNWPLRRNVEGLLRKAEQP